MLPYKFGIENKNVILEVWRITWHTIWQMADNQPECNLPFLSWHPPIFLDELTTPNSSNKVWKPI